MNRPGLSKPALGLLVLWVLAMVVQPVVLWAWGDGVLRLGLSVTVVVQAAAVLAILAGTWGARRTLGALALVTLVSFLAEWAGSQTGFPFGRYHYTDALQPQLAGVPLLIPLAWMMMLPPAWAVSNRISGGSGRGLPFVLLSALAITAWDLFLDPQMVAWGFWVWEVPGAYFGIPLVNFLGWILVSGVITWLAGPRALPSVPLLLVYTITWLLQTVGQGLFWSQPGPATCGFLAMGALVVLAWRPFPALGRQLNRSRRGAKAGERHA